MAAAAVAARRPAIVAVVRGNVLRTGVRRVVTAQVRDDRPLVARPAAAPRTIAPTAGIVRRQVTVLSAEIALRTETVPSGVIVPPMVTVLSDPAARRATTVGGQRLEPVPPDVAIVVMPGSPARLLKIGTRSASSRCVRRRKSRTFPTTSSPAISTRSPAAS